MEKPLVTLLLPCYNCEKTLDRFMRSVISESYRPLELICIDDGSTDDTAKLLKNFETILKESGVQYTVLTQENIGLGGAIQTGLLHAHGDFLCWADPDDFLLPGSVEKRATYLLQHPACGAVSSDAFVFDESDLKMRSTARLRGFRAVLNSCSFGIFCAAKAWCAPAATCSACAVLMKPCRTA